MLVKFQKTYTYDYLVLVRGIDACVWNAIGLWLRWINMELLLYLYTRINVCFENGLKWFI